MSAETAVKKYPGLAGSESLTACLASLRSRSGLPANHKLLMVIDQFEQWLHGKDAQERRSLVQALRHCDGARLQCLLLVRDDFWLAISRFMDELEVELLQGHNTALVDLFDRQHARKVLVEFGRAYSRLPDNPSELSDPQAAFIDRALAGLGDETDGKTISVRLALFADMVKSRAWTPSTLDEIGGAEGVGVTFLEETFCARGANPQHRAHERAARAVLEALLPEPGSNIKGHVRSYPELLDISGYGKNPRTFKEVMRILDSETRLLTPTEQAGNDGPVEQCLPRVRYYQLTHDYLVPSLRTWLTTKQRMTPSGRAELRLVERAKLWNARPERRQLPSIWEWLTIRCLTRSINWTPPQKLMMRVAARRHVSFAAGLAAVIMLFLVGGAEATSMAKEAINRFRAATAPVWLAFGQDKAIWPLMQFDPDPALRTQLIHGLTSLLVDPEKLIASESGQQDISVRRSLLLAAGEVGRRNTKTPTAVAGNRRTDSSQEFIRRLVDLYRNDVDPGIHAASEWSLRQFDQDDEIARANFQRDQATVRDRQWFVAAQGHTMVIVPGPVQGLIGSPKTESERSYNETLHSVRIPHSYSIASKETTVQQFQRFARESSVKWVIDGPAFGEPEMPQAMVSWYQAAAYCNWLSKEDGIPESQWCYLKNDAGEYGAGMRIAEDADERRGYRLPTEAEWEYACRAATSTARYCGNSTAYLEQYAVFTTNSQQSRFPVGSRKPNDFGLFDMLGNVAEWCQDHYSPEPQLARQSQSVKHDQVTDNDERVVRGGSYLDAEAYIRCAARSHFRAASLASNVGFRVARNYP